MAKRRPSNVRTTLAATALLVLFAIVVPWSCQLDTSPIIHRHPPPKPVQESVTRDDNDSGDDK